MAAYDSLFERLVANTVLADPDDVYSCWLWMGGMSNSGYPRLAVREQGKKSPVKLYAHRAMLEEFHDIEFPFDEAGHTCHNPQCVSPFHLEVQTRAYNMMDRRGCADFDYKGCMIPCLFPRHEAIDSRIDDWFEGRFDTGSGPCPF